VLPIVIVVAVIPGADAVGPLAVELPHAVARNERATPIASSRLRRAGRESSFVTAIFRTPPPRFFDFAAAS
jgi:hypothetical protein